MTTGRHPPLAVNSSWTKCVHQLLHAMVPPRLGQSLSRVVAAAGSLSRRRAERAVLDGRVAVSGHVCRKPALRIHEQEVLLDGEELKPVEESAPARLWRYHKPRGLVVTHHDPQGRPTVFEQLSSTSLPRLISVGRLDAESEGLLLLTTVGSLARKLELPSSGVAREYDCLVQTGQRDIDSTHIDELAAGLTLGDGTALRSISVQPSDLRPNGRRWVRMVLAEGKNREIRRVWAHYGFATLRLVRVSYGPFALGGLLPGEVEEVCLHEVERLQATAQSWPDEQGRQRRAQ